MKEFIKNLIERLEEEAFSVQIKRGEKEPSTHDAMLEKFTVLEIKEIVNQLAEEFATDINVVSKNGWILCSEKTPNNRDAVLVCATGKDEGVFISYYVEEEDRWRYDTEEGGHFYVDVIAWQPLPAPYKEGE